MKGAYRFPSRDDAINWISEQEGCDVEPMPTNSRAEYYRCKEDYRPYSIWIFSQ